MATELQWATVPNVLAPTFADSTALAKYHTWFLIQTLIGANPLGTPNRIPENWQGYWHLQYITSGSASETYQDGNTTYRTNNLWMGSDKLFSPSVVPAISVTANITSYDQNSGSLASYDINYSSATKSGTRGLVILRSPLINQRYYYMTIDMNSYTSMEPRIFLSSDQPTIISTTIRPTSNEGFSYFVNNNAISLVRLGFDISGTNINNNYGNKHSLSLSSDGSFYYYHTWNSADTFRAMFAFTGLKNTSNGDPRGALEIRVRDGEVNSQVYALNENNRGFIPASFVNMASNANIPSSNLPYAYNWWIDKNVISRATTFFKSPRHDGTNGGSTLVSSSVGVAQHLVNVWDYTDTFSPLYGQSNINAQFGEMPIIVGSEQIPINNGYCALRGRVPDFKYAPNNLVQGSVRPSVPNPNFEYVKIGGFWCPWASSIAPTM